MMIGRRKQVTDLRSIWPTEPDFSDWLAKEDGLALIAEDLGLNVEDAKRESRPGDYPADIVGHALGDEKHIIVIENQFGKTNHDHLGKLLTYAAMHSAMTGVWISEHVSPDHRKVVDWLNDNTPSQVSFYLAQLKAYKIGDSAVAPQLDVLCRPNIQAKLRRAEDATQSTETGAWRERAWEEILNYIADKNPPFKVQSPSDDHWSNISIGRSGFWIGLTLVPKNQNIGCELSMNVSWKREAFAQLLSQRQAIEAEIGAILDWREMPERKSARILLEAHIDPKDSNNMELVNEWMHEKSLAFYKAFHNRIKRVQPSAVPANDTLVAEISAGDEAAMDSDQDEYASMDEGKSEEVVRLQQAEPYEGWTYHTKITVVHGGVDKQDVDAIVNAANEQLRYGEGITKVIFDAAGRNELEAEIKQKYPEGTPTGTAVITNGYKLGKKIIHTPGPRWGQEEGNEATLLRACYRSCLEVADAEHLNSIGFCSISTSIFGYPLAEAAPLAVNTVTDYLKSHPGTLLQRVVFAMWGDEEYVAFNTALKEAA